MFKIVLKKAINKQFHCKKVHQNSKQQKLTCHIFYNKLIIPE